MMLVWCRDVSRSAPILCRYEGMQILFVEAPAPAHLMAHELPGIEQAVHCCPAYPEQLGSLLKGEKNILLVKTFLLHPDPLGAPVVCTLFCLTGY
jgi:hypothetical protein